MGRIRILLVEHNSDASALLRDFLQSQADMELLGTASNGVEGLEAIRTLNPDLVLMGLVMPRLSGLGILRELAARPELARPHVLVVSRVDSPEIIRQALELGADFYLIKPINLAELPALIRGLCGERRTGSSAEQILLDMGAEENSQRFRCARTAVELAAGSPEMMPLKAVYQETGRIEKTTPACVEKNIRALMNRLAELDTPAWRALWDRTPGRPTNKSFLQAMACWVRKRD